jgi:hypothetical protein
VTLRESAAESKLKTWLKSSPHNNARVDGNRLQIYDDNTWHRFRITWTHGVTQITVWDTWNRRHIDMQ